MAFRLGLIFLHWRMRGPHDARDWRRSCS
jgi:hypothetical protein